MVAMSFESESNILVQMFLPFEIKKNIFHISYADIYERRKKAEVYFIPIISLHRY